MLNLEIVVDLCDTGPPTQVLGGVAATVAGLVGQIVLPRASLPKCEQNRFSLFAIA